RYSAGTAEHVVTRALGYVKHHTGPLSKHIGAASPDQADTIVKGNFLGRAHSNKNAPGILLAAVANPGRPPGHKDPAPISPGLRAAMNVKGNQVAVVIQTALLMEGEPKLTFGN